MKIFAALLFILCCVLLSAAEKVVIERPENSEIQSITVDGDSLILKSNGKNYTFKFSELLSGKTVQAKKPVPKNLEEAFKYNGEWCFFNLVPGMLNRLCYLSNPKKSYKVFKKGTLLERVLYKNKYYARDLNKNIYRPDWGIKADFSPYLIPANKYFGALDDKIKSLNEDMAPIKKEIKTLERKISLSISTLKSEQKYYDSFLKENSDNSSKEIREQKQRYYNNLKLHQNNIKKQEEELEKLENSLKSFETELRHLTKLRQKLEKTYQKYVINGSKEIPKPKVSINF